MTQNPEHDPVEVISGEEEMMFEQERPAYVLPKVDRTNDEKLALIAALVENDTVDFKMEEDPGDALIANIKRVLDGGYLARDEENWKRDCMSRMAKWLVGKTLLLPYFCSSERDEIEIEVQVMTASVDRVGVCVGNKHPKLDLCEIQEIERTPTSCQAFSHFNDLRAQFERETGLDLYFGAPSRAFEMQLIEENAKLQRVREGVRRRLEEDRAAGRI